MDIISKIDLLIEGIKGDGGRENARIQQNLKYYREEMKKATTPQEKMEWKKKLEAERQYMLSL